jgi:hypothetical protein
MDDDLLKRADLAIRESQMIRVQARDNLKQAKIANTRLQTAVRSAYTAEERNRLIGLETVNLVASLEERLEGTRFFGKPAQGQFECRKSGSTPNRVIFRLLGSFWDT